MTKNEDIIEFHTQRINDINNGLLDHLGKTFALTLKAQSENIIKNPCEGYAPEE